ncbi:hypothetical protein OAS20_03070, partial [Gammaproteobacteria bacterium]|nr:hypothetical protein [Gammaproteobacteria bacterium]
MNKFTASGKAAAFALLLLGSTATIAAETAPRIGDFSLLDAEGYFHQMSWYDDHKALVLLSYSNDDKQLSKMLGAFSELRDNAGDSFEFFLIDSQGKRNRSDIAAAMAHAGISLPVLMDDAQLVGEALGLSMSGEVVVFDPKGFSVIARGFGEQALPVVSDLLSALDHSADTSSEVAAVSATKPDAGGLLGQSLRYPAREAHSIETPSYTKEIAPIIAENCASCHREGGIAPFAMDSHTMVLGWSPMIREVLLTKRMPPGQIDSHIGEFINDMVLADSDAQKLVHWIEAGSPFDGDSVGEGVTADPLAQLTWPTSEWAFGEPDYIIEVPPQEVPATGILDYYGTTVDIDIEEDRWVRASQYIP